MAADQRIRYKTQWNQFYAGLQAGGALWDVAAEQAAHLDSSTFSKFFPQQLPLVDFGCGTGTQSAYLMQGRRQVLGLDVSSTAIDMAARKHRMDGLEFMAIDEDDPEFFPRIQRQRGDMNVYIRGVLHQIRSEDFSNLARSLKILIGDSGRIYFIEVAASIREYFQAGPDNFSQLPGIMQRTFLSHLPPNGLALEDIPRKFPPGEFRIMASGESWLNTNIHFRNLEPIRIPAVYGVLAAT